MWYLKQALTADLVYFDFIWLVCYKHWQAGKWLLEVFGNDLAALCRCHPFVFLVGILAQYHRKSLMHWWTTTQQLTSTYLFAQASIILQIYEQASHRQWGSPGLKMPIHAHCFWQVILKHKVSQTDLVLVGFQGSLVGTHMQDYQSLCAAVIICSNLVNIQTDVHMHAHTDRILTSLHDKLSQLLQCHKGLEIQKCLWHQVKLVKDWLQKSIKSAKRSVWVDVCQQSSRQCESHLKAYAKPDIHT